MIAQNSSVLIIGSGGREHALGKKLNEDGVKKLYFMPGNAGTAKLGINLDTNIKDFSDIQRCIENLKIDLTIVGPEDPLAEGLVNYLQESGHKVIGPQQSAALLESSKIFARELMKKHGIPQPDYIICDTIEKAREAQKYYGFPVVVKADGLAAGKGVSVCQDETEFKTALTAMFVDKKFGKAGAEILIEQCLFGEEMSIFALCDDHSFKIIGTAQDHKRLKDNDEGPNTGGMGAYSPAVFENLELMKTIETRIISPTLQAMSGWGMPFTGFLYISVMLVDNFPYVIEFNVRLGDPETQVILPRLSNSLFDLLVLASKNQLSQANDIRFFPGSAACVVKVAEGYPEAYSKGHTIEISENGFNDCSYIIHAGTKKSSDIIVTNGGRVLNGVGLGPNLQLALDNAYSAIDSADFSESYFRKDIGQKGLDYLEKIKN